MEYINCPVCNSGDHRRLYLARDYNMVQSKNIFNVVECNKCKFIFLNPIPNKQEIPSFYPHEGYFRKADLRLRYKLDIFKTYIGKDKLGRILDIGCGYPVFLDSLKKKGWDVRGVDLSKIVAVWAKKDFGIEVDVGEIIDISYPENYFDVITLWHSFEHILDIENTLNKIYRCLRQKGVLVICIPNVDSFQAKLFKGKWYHIDSPRHLYLFSRSTLNRILNKLDFVEKKADYHLFIDTYFGWLFSILNLLHLNTKRRDTLFKRLKNIRWILSLPIKLIVILPLAILSCCEESFGRGSSITMIFGKK